jgi:SAM-dependent methyltransferase
MISKLKLNHYSSVKKLPDNRSMLNVGCGSRTCPSWNNMDFSPIIFFVHHPIITTFFKKINLLSEDRVERINSIDPDIVNHDLSKGVPWDDNVFDVIYHSHFLEHLDRYSAKYFLNECYRCLKKGGILRVVIPDLNTLITNYNSTYFSLTEGDETAISQHESSVYELFYQMVDSQLSGPQQQGGFVGKIESILRGNTIRGGEAHLWMYDQYTLKSLLLEIGFKSTEVLAYNESNILNWNSFGLDMNEDGSIYKENSLYMEAFK